MGHLLLYCCAWWVGRTKEGSRQNKKTIEYVTVMRARAIYARRNGFEDAAKLLDLLSLAHDSPC